MDGEQNYVDAFLKNSETLINASDYHNKCQLIEEAIQNAEKLVVQQLMQVSLPSQGDNNVPEDCAHEKLKMQ